MWIHAVSLGEMKAISILAKKFIDVDIIVTTMTSTGLMEAKTSIPQALCHMMLPFDLACIQKRYMSKYRPDKILLCETDLWFHFLNEGKKIGAEIYLVNGKISQKSYGIWRKLSMIHHMLFGLVDYFFMQTEEYKERLLDLGHQSAKIFVTGNLKYDAEIVKLSTIEKNALKHTFNHKGKPVVVISCTHEGEEELLVEALFCLLDHITLIVVPRHPSRYKGVELLFKSKNWPYSRISSGKVVESLILYDQMYGLIDLYQISSIVVLAGSFKPIGGHNLIEPLKCGALLVYGPYTEKQKEMSSMIERYNAGTKADSGNISQKIKQLLENREQREEILSNARILLKNLEGSTEKCYQEMTKKKR